jgi:hypothetical protein
MFRLLLLLTAGAVVLGAQTPVGGPSLGFIFDAQGQALRPILGIPGASIFGGPLAASAPLSAAAISLRQNIAIINDGAWKALSLAQDASDAAALPDGLPAGARVAVSETGTAAAFYDADNSALSVVTGIGSSATAAAVSLDGLPGGITAFAAADDGSLLLTAAVPDGGEGLFWIGQDGSMRQLASLQGTSSILLWNHGANALVADRAGNQVWSLQDPGGNAALTQVASDADGVSGPAGAAMSADGKQLWIANATTRTVLGIDINTRSAVSLSCGFDLTTMLPTTDGVSFRLTDLTGGPLWILDATPGMDPRVVFVPAVPAAATSEEASQ